MEPIVAENKSLVMARGSAIESDMVVYLIQLYPIIVAYVRMLNESEIVIEEAS